jgi:2-oxo-hept-3-ene-1,7-dioate hydratase
MALSQDDIRSAAERLDQAEKTRRQIRQLSLEHPGITIEDAYAIQKAWVEMKVAEGRTVKGHKIGLTSKAMQNAVSISEPDYGVLFADMFYPDASPIPFDRFHAPRIEVELAFVLKTPLEGPECTLFDVLNATDYVTPALEILETRMHRVDPETKAPRKVMDTISDNAANAALVVGGRPIRPLDFDLRWIGALLFRNGQIEETGIAAGVLNHPANGVAWLADRLAAQGEFLDAGEVVLAGSFTRPVEIIRGDTFHADYGQFGSVSCQFV